MQISIEHETFPLCMRMTSEDHSGPENLKKSKPKKNSWNQINQFHEVFSFGQFPFFCNFKNQFFELRKSLKLPKMQFHEKKLIYLISRVFFMDFFFNFLAHCEEHNCCTIYYKKN